MTNPQPAPGRQAPRRAEPLQPDAPGQGDEKVSKDDETPDQESTSDDPDAALRNVREGYK